jgi:hypothetical protein
MLSYTEDAVTLEEAAEYHASRGNAAWGANSSDADKTTALRRSQDYIAGQYNGYWATEWDMTSVPIEVEYAISEGALRELASPGSLAPDNTGGGGAIKELKAGSVGIVYSEGTASGPAYSAIDNLLSGLVKNTGGASFVNELVRT